MRRVRIVGLCLVAVLACGAMLASAAQAAEVGECLKLAKVEGVFHGKYVDKSCQVAATPLQEAEGKHNKYEWSPGVSAANASFTGKGQSAEKVGAAGTIACSAKSKLTGEWTGPKTAREQIAFDGCAFKGAIVSECHTPGQEPYVIATSHLQVSLIGHGETGLGGAEPAEGEVWSQLLEEPGVYWSEWGCSNAKPPYEPIIRVRESGSLSGVFTPASINLMGRKTTIEFNGVLGESPGNFGEQDLVSEASIGGGPWEPAGAAVLKATVSTKGGKVEIKP